VARLTWNGHDAAIDFRSLLKGEHVRWWLSADVVAAERTLIVILTISNASEADLDIPLEKNGGSHDSSSDHWPARTNLIEWLQRHSTKL
jgi:hypothetical protein